jgi:hypothetical protein
MEVCTMGGPGSTRWQGKPIRTLVEKTPRASIDDYYPRPNHKGHVTLCVRDPNDGREYYRRRVPIVLVPRPNDGYALRFVCDCGRQCRYLYYVDENFRCQKCGRLLHQSTRTSHDFGFESLFRQICREKNITDLTFGQFIKHFRRK